MLSGKKTKHIKAKFFFIKDRVDDGEVKVLDCPSEEMWVDIRGVRICSYPEDGVLEEYCFHNLQNTAGVCWAEQKSRGISEVRH